MNNSALQQLSDDIAFQSPLGNIPIPTPFTEIVDRQPTVITVSQSITGGLQNTTQSITEEATGPAGAVVQYSANGTDNRDGTATLEEDGMTITQDNIGGNIAISCEPPSGSEFPLGETEVECTANDTAGNIASRLISVVVQDTRSPELINVPENMTVETDGNSSEETFALTAEDAVGGVGTLGEDNILTQGDDVGGNIAISCEPPSGSEFPLGETEVECTTVDESGNVAEEQFRVIVVEQSDTTAPDITINPTQNNTPVVVP